MNQTEIYQQCYARLREDRRNALNSSDTGKLYTVWQDLERQATRIMENGGTALGVRTDAAIAKEAYLQACIREGRA